MPQEMRTRGKILASGARRLHSTVMPAAGLPLAPVGAVKIPGPLRAAPMAFDGRPAKIPSRLEPSPRSEPYNCQYHPLSNTQAALMARRRGAAARLVYQA